MAEVVAPSVAVAAPARTRAEWRKTARTLTRNPLVVAGLALVIALLLIAALADLIAPYDPIANNVRAALQPHLRDASCCIVVVRNGGTGLRV